MSADFLRRAVRGSLVALCLLGGVGTAARAQIGIGVALPGVRIGVNIPVYPNLVPVPGFPVYYAPGLDVNLFFYDGLYWVFADDQWYSSTWYDGPWYPVAPMWVPDFILRIPVRFYRRPPLFFRGWNRNAAPRWGERFGPSWRRSRPHWDRWNRRAVPPRAPLPRYQRNYPRRRYPGAREQRDLRDRFYRSPQRAQPPRNQRERRAQPPRYPQNRRAPLQRYQQERRGYQPRQQRRTPQQQRGNQEQQRRRDREHRPGERPPG